MREKRTSASNGLGGTYTSRGFSKQNPVLGGAARATPGPPKNPVFGPAKKSSLPPAKMCKKWGFWAKKRAFSVNLCTILHKNDLFFADIAPRYRAASPSGKNPPIYTVLNAAFSAPGPPPPVAPWWDTSSRRPPTGSRRPF